MKRKEPTKTFMMISNFMKPLVSMVYTQIFNIVRVNMVFIICVVKVMCTILFLIMQCLRCGIEFQKGETALGSFNKNQVSRSLDVKTSGQ